MVARSPSRLHLGVIALALSAVLGAACSSSQATTNGSGASSNCPIGTEACPCTQGGACDPELSCRSGLCVRLGGGTGGTGNGTGGVGNGTGGAGPTLPSCSTSSDCATDEVCAVKVDGTAYCLKGSGKDCTNGDVCIHAMGFDSLTGKIEGPACSGPSDCNMAIEGHLNSVCIRDTGSTGTCVPLCQYYDDPANLNCVTHPWIGLNDACTRSQIRTIAWMIATAPCVDFKVVTWSCNPSPRALTADEDWMLSCMESSFTCAPLNCFAGTTSPPEAKLVLQDYLDLLSEMVTYSTTPIPSGSGGSSQCGADCDCGHCEYCESGQCRYGGEGPYGCYRGCD